MPSQIHSTAIVHKNAKLADDVEVGPYAVIGGDVKIGAGTKVHTHVVIDGHTTIGKNNEFFPGCVIGFQGQDKKFKGEKSLLIIGDNGIFREYVTIHKATGEDNKTVIGNDVFFMATAHVGHNCTIGDGVTLVNGAGIGGHVEIEERAFISAYCPVHQFCKIGKFAMIGMGSPIEKDVPPFVLGVGNPFTIYGYNKVGLSRAGVAPAGLDAIKKLFKLVFKSGLNVSQAVEKLKSEMPGNEFAEHFIKFTEKSKRGIYK
jgi:UDP-N-acetylglucosamine acyltransferase